MTPGRTSPSNEYTLPATFAAMGETEAQNALPAVVLHDETGVVVVLDGPGRRSRSDSHQVPCRKGETLASAVLFYCG
jgi:hypothetical protein